MSIFKLKNNGQIVITYDGDGNCMSRTAGGITNYYLVDEVNPSGYAQVVEEYQGTGLTNVYNYGMGLISQCQPGISTNYFIYDGHGSTRMLTDLGGNVVNVFVYDAFGNLIASNGVPQTGYLYSGQQFDPDLGLYYNRARYVNTDIGRFTTMDTYAGNNEDPLSLHRYLYGEDGPVDNDDPSGDDIEGNINAAENFSVNLNVGLVGEIAFTPNATIGPGDSITVNNIEDGQTITLQNGTVKVDTFEARPSSRKHDIDDIIGAIICMVPHMNGPDTDTYKWRQYVITDDPDPAWQKKSGKDRI
jgi:RHS repeat-associated protein